MQELSQLGASGGGKALLVQGWYQPQPSCDMWSLGQLMLYTVAGDMLEAQRQLQTSEAYLREIGPSCIRAQ